RATVRGARPRRPRTRAAAPVPGPAAGAPLNHRPLCCPRRASATHREARMARRYTAMTRGQRIGNAVVALLVRIGLGPKDTYLLTVPGRRTGKPYTTPVTLVQTGEGRWLVAPYGAVSWVRNARAAGRVTLRRGNRTGGAGRPGYAAGARSATPRRHRRAGRRSTRTATPARGSDGAAARRRTRRSSPGRAAGAPSGPARRAGRPAGVSRGPGCRTPAAA